LSQSCIICDEVNSEGHGELEYTTMKHRKSTFLCFMVFFVCHGIKRLQ